MAGQTPSQTVGPYFAYGLVPESYGRPGIASGTLVGERTPGERIVLTGRVLDGRGAPVPDALVEIWQADAAGVYANAADTRGIVRPDPGFRGFGRVGTDADGFFRFLTIRPGRVPGRGNSLQAPHVNIILFARGTLSHAYTRLYFTDEEAANAEDPVLATVPEARRATLLAKREEQPDGTAYRLDINLQGEHETVFFDV